MNLRAIFPSVQLPEFFGDYFGVAPLHSAGPADRFTFLEPPRRTTECLCGECAVCAPALALAWKLEFELEAPLRAKRVSELSAGNPETGERDLIVLQVAGRTDWKLYGNEGQPSTVAERCVELESGGALYVPRTWWRSALPFTGEAVSWFFFIDNPTGADLLLWLANKVKDSPVFQADIPRFATLGARTAYLTRLRKAFAGAFRIPGLLEAHARRLNRLAPFHPAQGKTWSEGLTLDHSILLVTPRFPRILRRNRETICLAIGGTELLFPTDAAPLLQYVLDKAPTTIAEFYAEFKEEFEREDLAQFLAALSRDRVITFAAPEPHD